MAHITTEALIREKGVTILYKINKWTFMYAYQDTCGTVVIVATFKMPKFAGGGEQQRVYPLDIFPGYKDAYGIYLNLKEEFDQSIKADRIAYYKNKLAKLEGKKEEETFVNPGQRPDIFDWSQDNHIQ